MATYLRSGLVKMLLIAQLLWEEKRWKMRCLTNEARTDKIFLALNKSNEEAREYRA